MQIRFLYSGFCWRDIPHNSCFSLHTFQLKPA